MRIKTITCHDVYNHGATLQAYALMKYLEMQGYDVSIINYKPYYLSSRLNPFAVTGKWKHYPLWVRVLYLIAKLPVRCWTISKSCKRAFDDFNRGFLKLTPVRYRNCDELTKSPPLADVYITGSDQIWNVACENGRDPAFYLDFAPVGTKRISYAASFSTREVAFEFKSFVRDKIDKIDSISVRERQGLKILASLGISRGTHVLDPVFLHDRNFWSEFTEDIEHEDYVLVYDFEHNPEIRSFVKNLAEELSLKIYAVNNYSRTQYADKDYYNAGPRIFLSLIKNATVVVGNSFHALAFSLIFEKEFFVFGRTGYEINSRMEDLLDLCGLLTRLVPAGRESSNYQPIDYEVVHSILTSKVTESKKFLNESILA